MFKKQLLSKAAMLAFMLSAAATAGAEDVRVPSVTVENVIETEVIVRTPVTGTLVPFERVQVNTELSGLVIRQVLVEVGSFVAKGDTLLVLDEHLHEVHVTQASAETLRARASERQAGSQVDTADVNLAQAVAALNRALQLKDSGSISQVSFDQAVANEATARASLVSAQNGFSVSAAQIRVAEAQYELAVLNLGHTHIRARCRADFTNRRSVNTARYSACCACAVLGFTGLTICKRLDHARHAHGINGSG